MLLHVKHPPCSPARALGAKSAKMSSFPQGLSRIRETTGKESCLPYTRVAAKMVVNVDYGSLKDTMKHQNLVD